MILPAKLVNERLMFLIDYGDKLPWGSVVTGAKIEVTVSSGEDTTPQKVFSQVWDIDGTIVTYQVRNGLPGVVYDLNTAVQVSGEWLYMTVKLAVLPDSGDVGALYPLTRVFTSLPYVQLMTDEISQSLEPTSGVLVQVLYESDLQPDNVDISMTPNGGELIPPATGKFLDEVTLSAATPTDGDLFTPPPAIADPGACVSDVALEPSTGILAIPPLGNIQIEEIDLVLVPTGGTLSTSINPDWADVASLLHFDGTDGSTTFVDETGRTWTAANGARIETDFSQFGGASGWFENVPGSGSENGSRISTPDHADLRFGTGNWTVEGWFRPKAPGLGFGAFFRKGQNTANGLQLAVTPTQLTLRANTFTDTNVAVSLSSSAFTHVAFVRNGGNVLFFVGGVLVHTAARSFDHSSTDPLLIGSVTGDTRYSYNGMIDELRITKGVALYTATFTPPSAPFPNS